MNHVDFDEQPEYGGMCNFASNAPEIEDIATAKVQAFNYGFRLGWQICWYEHNKKPEPRLIDAVMSDTGRITQIPNPNYKEAK